MADFDRARVVDMATAQIGHDTRVKIIFEIPATIEGIEGAIDIMEEVRKDLPPGCDHGGNWAIKAIHGDKCKSKESRSMDDCSCESLICECIQISATDEALLRSTGGFDMEVEMGREEGETDFN
jgi:hypothetical protein